MTCPCESIASFFPPPCPPRPVHAFFWNITLEIGLTVQEAYWIANYCGVPDSTVAPTTTIAKTSSTLNKTIRPSPTNTSTIPPLHPSPTTISSIPHSASFDIWIIIIIVATIVIFIVCLAAFIIICRKKDICGQYTNAFQPTHHISTDSTTSTTELVHAENEIYADDVREENINNSKSLRDLESGATSKPTHENNNSAIFERNVPHKTNLSGITVYYHKASLRKDEFHEMSFSTDTNEEKADTDSNLHDNITPEPPEIPKVFSPITAIQSEKKDVSETLKRIENQRDHAIN